MQRTERTNPDGSVVHYWRAESAYIHPSATIRADARIGPGAFVAHSAVIGPRATIGDAFVGPYIYVGAGSVIPDHACIESVQSIGA